MDKIYENAKKVTSRTSKMCQDIC